MIEFLARMLGFGRVTMVDDSDELQLLQITEGASGNGLTDRIIDRVRRVTEFGFASAPPLDSEVVMLRRGDRSSSLVIATSHRPSRPRDLKPGDAGIYDVRGAIVMLTDQGLVIDCAGLPATITGVSTLTIEAAERVRIDSPTLEVTGDVVSRADGVEVSLNALRDAYAAHKHSGVTAGAALSGLTDHSA